MQGVHGDNVLVTLINTQITKHLRKKYISDSKNGHNVFDNIFHLFCTIKINVVEMQIKKTLNEFKKINQRAQ